MGDRETFEELDRVRVLDDWAEIERRAARSDAPIDLPPEPPSATRRIAAAVVAVAVFAGVAFFAWTVFRSGDGLVTDAVRPAQGHETGEVDTPAPTAQPIIEIEDGYLLYEGVWQEIAWELVAVEAPRPRLRCGEGPLTVAYRDSEGYGWLGCPDPQISRTAFPGPEGALVVGTLGEEVSSIRAETEDGRVVEGLIVPLDAQLGSGFNAFVIHIPAPYPGSVVARDAQGTVLQEFELRPMDQLDIP